MAVEAGFVAENPISKRRFPKFKEIPRDKVLTGEEEGRLLEIMAREAPHILPMVRFALQVPCRRSELVNMNRDDVNWFSNPPSIRVRNGTTKSDQGMNKPIPPDLIGYFRSIPAGCPFLFYRMEKGVYKPLGDFKKAWTRCLHLAGIVGFRFHDTRHISASTMVDLGTPERVVMQIAGWLTPMLSDYYHRAGTNSLHLARFSSQRGTLGVHPMNGDSGKSPKSEQNSEKIAIAL